MITIFFFCLASFFFSRFSICCPPPDNSSPLPLKVSNENDEKIPAREPNYFIQVKRVTRRSADAEAIKAMRAKSLNQRSGINETDSNNRILSSRSNCPKPITKCEELVQSYQNSEEGEETGLQSLVRSEPDPVLLSSDLEQNPPKITSKPSILTRKFSFLSALFKGEELIKTQPENLELMEQNLIKAIKSIPPGFLPKEHLMEGILWFDEGIELTWNYFSIINDLKNEILMSNVGDVFHLAFLRFNALLIENFRDPDQFAHLPYFFEKSEGGSKFCYHLWTFWEFNKFVHELALKEIFLPDIYDFNLVLLLDFESLKARKREQNDRNDGKKPKMDEGKFLEKVFKKFITLLSDLRKSFPKAEDSVNRYAGFWVIFAKANYDLAVRYKSLLSLEKPSRNLFPTKNTKKPPSDMQRCSVHKQWFLYLYKELERIFQLKHN